MPEPAPLQVAFPASAEVPVTREPLTIAVRICSFCTAILGLAFWRGPLALKVDPVVGVHPTDEPGTSWCRTDSICEDCLGADDAAGEPR